MTGSPQPHRFGFAGAPLVEEIAHGGRSPVLTWRARTGTPGTAFNFFDITIVPPGAEIGIHRHADDNEETYIVVSGRGRMEVDGEVIDIEAGDIVINRPGGTHALVNTAEEDLRIVVIELKVAG